MDKVSGFLAPIFIAALVYILNALLPGRWITGYITRPGSAEKMKYHINGIFVLMVVILLWFILGHFKIVPYDFLYTYRWYSLAGAFIFGIIFSLTVVLRYPPVRKSFPADLFFGRAENIQTWSGRVDMKMWLYLYGAIMLELNVLSITAHHISTFGDNSSANIVLCAGLLSFFVIEYLIFERVHLYTYDIFAERIGFKLGWGCIVFYSFFYAIPLWSTADLPASQSPSWLLIISVIIFLSGWTLARGANMQKYFFKRDSGKAFLGITPMTISDGNKTLLINGFWGLSRHINYLGEVLMATGIALSAGFPMLIWPWLYPLYYVIFLSTRQFDDNRRCSLKYGELWQSYKEKVPWRIIPFIW